MLNFWFWIFARFRAPARMFTTNRFDWLKLLCGVFVILTICLSAVILIFLILFSLPFLQDEAFASFFGTIWDPKNALFGIRNFLISTFWTLFFTIILVVIFTIFMAVFICKFLPRQLKAAVLFMLQVLSGLPSVVFGMFGAFVFVKTFQSLGIEHAKSMMVVILVLTLMVLPTTVVLTVNILDSVSQEHEFSAYALGVDKVTTAFQVVSKFCKRKILLVLLYGFCRSIGEVTAISLIAGNGPSAPPLDQGFEAFFFHSITTISSLIGLESAETVSNLHASALYTVGLVLLLFVFLANLVLFFILDFRFRRPRRFTRSKQPKSPFPGFGFSFSPTPLWWQAMRRYYARCRTLFQLFMMYFTFTFATGAFLWIFGDIIFNGFRVFRFDWLVATTGEAALLSVLITTLILVISCIIFAFPFAFFVALFISEYGRDNYWLHKLAQCLYFFIRQLTSSPTIIFGMFGLSVFVVSFNLGFSIFAAALTMILIILPIMIQTLVQNLNSVPNYYRYSAAALALPRHVIILRLIIPYILRGIAISVILSINKIIAESAPLVLTMGTNPIFPRRGIFSSGRSLSTHIYLLQNENLSANMEAISYQTAFLTLLFIFALNTIVYLFTHNLRKKG